MPEPRRVSIKDWLETAPPAIRGCITDDKVFLDNNKCTTDVFCPYRLANNNCRKHTQRQTGDTHVVLASVPPQIATIDGCVNGNHDFYRGGICTAGGTCSFQTQVRFGIKGLDPSKTYPVCLKHCPTALCAAGKKMMFYKGVCLATGLLECRFQFKEMSDPVEEEGGRMLAYCGQFNKFD
jgi:hypothetical protein